MFFFFNAGEHESFQQIDTIIFDGDGQSIPKVPKIVSLQCLYNISEKKLEIKLIFRMHMNITFQHFGPQSFL